MWDSFLKQVRHEMGTAVTEEMPSLLADPLRYLLQRGGKLLRAKTYFYCSRMVSPQAVADPKVGAILETLHNASLLHDDVLDDSPLRRGDPTVNLLWTDKVSILAGDYLLGWVEEELLRLQKPLMNDIFSSVLKDMAIGEVAHLEFSRATRWDLPQYEKVVALKTASLFAAAAQAACTFAPEPLLMRDLLKRFGRAWGIFYQYYDDWGNYFLSPEVTGKPMLCDFQNRVVTWPLVTILEYGTPFQREEVLASFAEDPSSPKTTRLLDVLCDKRLRHYLAATVKGKLGEVQETLRPFPNNEARGQIFSMIGHTMATMVVEEIPACPTSLK